MEANLSASNKVSVNRSLATMGTCCPHNASIGSLLPVQLLKSTVCSGSSFEIVAVATTLVFPSEKRTCVALTYMGSVGIFKRDQHRDGIFVFIRRSLDGRRENALPKIRFHNLRTYAINSCLYRGPK